MRVSASSPSSPRGRARSLTLATALAACALLQASPSQAEPAAAAPTPSVSLPDVLVTHSGLMVRGTITLRDPEGDIEIQTASGELRRFPFNEVQYAGPATSQPPPPPRQPTPPSQPTPPPTEPAAPPAEKPAATAADGVKRGNVRLLSVPEGVRFHLKWGVGIGATGAGRVSVASYDSLCIAPCATSLPLGLQEFALSREGKAPIPVERAVDITEGATLTGSYVDRSTLRVVGGVMFGVGLLGAGLAPLLLPDRDSSDYTGFFVLAGGGVALTTAGSIMLFMPDKVEIERRGL